MPRPFTPVDRYEHDRWFKTVTMAFGLSRVEYVSLPAEGRYFDKKKNCGSCRFITSIMLWFALALFTFSQIKDVTCEYHGLQECEFSSIATQDKWHAADGRTLRNVHIRSRSNLIKVEVHTASILNGRKPPYRQNCRRMVMDPVGGGCDAGEQVQVPPNKLNQSLRDGGCNLNLTESPGAWCTKFNASMQGTFGDQIFTFASINVFWNEWVTNEQIDKEEPGFEISWRIPVTVQLSKAGLDEAGHDAGYQVVYYSLKKGLAQKNELFFSLHEEVLYTPTTYFLKDIGLGFMKSARPTEKYELILDNQFSRPAIAKDRFAGQFYLRAAPMRRIVTRRPTLNIGAVPSHIGGFAQFLIAIGTVSFLGCQRSEICLQPGIYDMARDAKEVSPDELNVVNELSDVEPGEVSSAVEG